MRSGLGGRSDIPNFPERTDEIGDLADSLRSMTGGLYDRIDAIESFAADVAHELKNPLTSLASAVEMFSRAKDEESRARLLDIVRGDVKRIDRLITDISDASRLDAELSREAKEPVELSRLLATIIEIYRMTDSGGGIRAAGRVAAGRHVLGRDERLGQVFRNLIDNAVSFSPRAGKVTVTATRSTTSSPASRWRMKAPAFRPTIWNPSSSASTPSGRARTSGAIPAWAFPSPARSSKAPAAASMRRTAPRQHARRRRALDRRTAAGAARCLTAEKQYPCQLRRHRRRGRAAAGRQRRGQVRPGAAPDR